MRVLPARLPTLERSWSAPDDGDQRQVRFESLLLKLTAFAGPLLLVNALLNSSRVQSVALASLVVVPLYLILGFAAGRYRRSLLGTTWFRCVLFGLHALLISLQCWAFAVPAGRLWLAYLAGLIIAAARWQRAGAVAGLAWFSAGTVINTIGLGQFPNRDMVRELTLELAGMTIVALVFGAVFLELKRTHLGLRASKNRLRASAARLTAVLDHVAEAIVTIDDEDVVDSANRAAGELFGCDPAALVGSRVEELLPGYRTTVDELIPLAGNDHSSRHDAWGRRRDQTSFAAELETSLILGDDGPVRIVVLRDVTDLRARTAALTHQANHDALTGLANRHHFTQQLLARVNLARETGRPFSLFLMDMDGFKDVNDRLGHHAGDQLLQAVGLRLGQNLRDSDLIARLGGDEFAIIPSVDATPDTAPNIARQVIAAFQQPFCLDGHTIDAGISVGVANFPDHGDDGDTLMRHADAAMYTAKRGRLGWTVFAGAEIDVDDPFLHLSDLGRAIGG